MVVNALVSSRLDYCNALVGSLSQFNLGKLHCIKNNIVRVNTGSKRHVDVKPIL